MAKKPHHGHHYVDDKENQYWRSKWMERQCILKMKMPGRYKGTGHPAAGACDSGDITKEAQLWQTKHGSRTRCGGRNEYGPDNNAHGPKPVCRQDIRDGFYKRILLTLQCFSGWSDPSYATHRSAAVVASGCSQHQFPRSSGPDRECRYRRGVCRHFLEGEQSSEPSSNPRSNYK